MGLAVVYRRGSRVVVADPPILAAHHYAPGPVRDIAYRLKDADPQAVELAAGIMAPLVTGRHPVFVPVPSSRGDTTANRLLAAAIAAQTNGTVCDLLGRQASVPSSLGRRKAGGESLTVRQHRMVRRGGCAGELYLVDNALATGNTLRAARAALGTGTGLVWSLGRDWAQRVEVAA